MNYDKSPTVEKVSTEKVSSETVRNPLLEEQQTEKSLFCKLHNAHFKNVQTFQAHVKKFHARNEQLIIDARELRNLATPTNGKSAGHSANSIEPEHDSGADQGERNDEESADDAEQPGYKDAFVLIHEAIRNMVEGNFIGMGPDEKILLCDQFLQDAADFLLFKALTNYTVDAASKGELHAVTDVTSEQDLTEKYEDVQHLRDLSTLGDKVKSFGDVAVQQRNIEAVKEAAFRKIGRWHEHGFRKSKKRTSSESSAVSQVNGAAAAVSNGHAEVDNSSKKIKTK